MSADARPVRTYLAVPAHRHRLVQSAAASAADAVFMDLEDAVPPGEKAAALDAAVQALAELDWGHKSVSVRLNASIARGSRGRSTPSRHSPGSMRSSSPRPNIRPIFWRWPGHCAPKAATALRRSHWNC